MNNKVSASLGLREILGEGVRKSTAADGRVLYAAADVVRALSENADSADNVLKSIVAREPQLAKTLEQTAFATTSGSTETVDCVDLEGVFRLVQSIPSARCERLKGWLARAARERAEESENPELLALRARKLYEQKGFNRRWIDKRLRGISARHELTGEWYKRGATDSEAFRSLTNALMHETFGLDVESYRRYKNLTGSGANLRDHMTGLELALTALGETTAVALHQARDSRGSEELETDARDAGQIVAAARAEFDRRSSGNPVVSPAGNGWVRNRPARPRRLSPPGATPLAADKAADASRAPERGTGDGSPEPGDGSPARRASAAR